MSNLYQQLHEEDLYLIRKSDFLVLFFSPYWPEVGNSDFQFTAELQQNLYAHMKSCFQHWPIKTSQGGVTVNPGCHITSAFLLCQVLEKARRLPPSPAPKYDIIDLHSLRGHSLTG